MQQLHGALGTYSLEFLDAIDTIKEKEVELIEKEHEIKKEEELKTKR